MNETTNPTPQGKPWPLYIIVGMVALVLVLGFFLSPKTEEGKIAWIEFLGTTNKGILLNPPTAVVAGQIVNGAGQPWEGLEDNTWKLLVLNPGQCEQACTERLVELHSMRVRLNRDAGRLTVGLLTWEQQSLPETVSEFSDVNLTFIGDKDFLLSLEATNMPTLKGDPVVLLMNPIDVMMMAYDQSHTGVDMLEDLEHLLDLAH